MSHYWLISVPADGNKQNAFTSLKNAIAPPSHDYAETYPFIIPDLKIGSLDSLMVLSDDLVKIDSTFEAAVLKVVDIMRSLLHGDAEQLKANLTVNEKSVETYLKNFQWNTMKYRVDKPLREITETIQQEVGTIDNLMKSKANAYNQIRTNLASLERKQVGNLSVRSLADIVKKEHFVLDSEFLMTQLVAVPRSLYKVWTDNYETLTDKVVPRSSVKIAEDDEYGLFTVIIFQKVVDEFCHKCRENKFIPRDFKYSETDIQNSKKEIAELGAQEKEQWALLLRLCKTNFGELFSCWIHIKALRVFVESVLRYGLPPDFMSAIVKPKTKHIKKSRDVLNNLYSSIIGSGSTAMAATGSKKKDKALEQVFEEMSVVAGVEKEFYNYVWYGWVWDVDGSLKI
ncbi:hypothetical protein BKA69DRAFT_1109454 [Paraphysoderma sedebokerense]|nr:hypothetical protein BKA69DRAFT_1109454 [Paraphysoderma sedebokerense]